MRVGDIVEPVEGLYLHSGCSRYPDAVVVSMEPFELMSRSTDMLWMCTVEPHDFVVTGRADAKQMDRCKRRRTPGTGGG